MRRKSLAIPIRVVNWSDTSQVVGLFSREAGIVDAVAKGAHRFPNPFQGPFDLAVLWDVVFAERSSDRGLSILTEGMVSDGFPGLRRHWAAWVAGAFVVEYLRAAGTAGEPSHDLFDAAVEALKALSLEGIREAEGSTGVPGEGEDRLSLVVAAFEARAFRILGLSAPQEACVGCGRRWPGTDRPVFFSGRAGGILCSACRAKDPASSGVLVPGRAVHLQETLASGSAGPDPLTEVPAAGAETMAPAPASSGSSQGASSGRKAPALLAGLKSILGELRAFHLEHPFQMIKYAAKIF